MSTTWQRIKQWVGTTFQRKLEAPPTLMYFSRQDALQEDVEHLKSFVQGAALWMAGTTAIVVMIYTAFIAAFLWWALRGGC